MSRRVPSPLPCLNVMFANADQLTSSKKVELMECIEKEKPLVIAICEIKPKNFMKNGVNCDFDINNLPRGKQTWHQETRNIKCIVVSKNNISQLCS